MKSFLPPWYILYSPAILYLIIYAVFLSLKKAKAIFFGFMLFFITMLPSAGFLDIGSFAVADRYTYIPYLGLFFILAKTVSYLYNRTNKYCKVITVLLCLIIFATLCHLTYNKTLDWKETKYMAPRSMKYYKFGFKNIPKLNEATYFIK